MKRPLDILLALAGMVVSLPLWLILAVWIRLEDGGPVFFRQSRIGRYGTPFRVLKFRSMRTDPHLTEIQAQRDDPRQTRVGRFMRRTALDELPQLWNILIGEMSFVGPRAQPEREVVRVGSAAQPLIMREVPGFAVRQLVRPGLTGIAQLYAPREVPHRQKFRYDNIYVRRLIHGVSGMRDRGPLSRLRAEVDLACIDLALIVRSAARTLRRGWEV